MHGFLEERNVSSFKLQVLIPETPFSSASLFCPLLPAFALITRSPFHTNSSSGMIAASLQGQLPL